MFSIIDDYTRFIGNKFIQILQKIKKSSCEYLNTFSIYFKNFEQHNFSDLATCLNNKKKKILFRIAILALEGSCLLSYIINAIL